MGLGCGWGVMYEPKAPLFPSANKPLYMQLLFLYWHIRIPTQNSVDVHLC